jgi:serine/threonine protein kinase
MRIIPLTRITGIIHGDIKPQNVLIFEHDGKLTARVADFGFSTYFRGPQDLIRMPRSPIWCAPEWHNASFSPEDAHSMDIFSFGLMCLWVLLASASVKEFPLRPGFVASQGQGICFDKSLPAELNLIEVWKRDGSKELQKWASWLPSILIPSNTDVCNRLSKFFQLALTTSPETRCTNLGHILHLLDPNR